MKLPAVYVMANKRNGTLYIGVTSDLMKRAYEHRPGTVPGFTSHYGCKILVYYEIFEDMISAIEREKKLKSGPRKRKITLIEQMNPSWRDLYDEIHTHEYGLPRP